MGALNSKLDGAFITNPKRFNIKEVVAYSPTEEEDRTDPSADRYLLKVEFDQTTGSPTFTRPHGRPIEWVDSGSGILLPKIPGSSLITLRFKLSILVTPSNPVSSVTFVTAPTRRELDSFVATELLENPNLQNEDNVVLLGDFAPRTDAPDIISYSFEYPVEQKEGPLYFCFCEYIKKSHTLNPVARAAVWVPELTSEIFRIQSPVVDILSPDATISPMKEEKFLQGLQTVPPSQPPLGQLSFQQPPIAQYGASQPSGSQPQSGSSTQLPPINTQSTQLNQPVISHTQSGSDLLEPSQVEHLDDGPLFRSKVLAMERRTTVIKTTIKLILKRALLLHERLKDAAEALRWFSGGLVSSANSDVPAFRALTPYFSSSNLSVAAYRVLLLKLSSEMVQYIIDPMRNMYERDIKPLEIRKKEFDEESSQYYSWVSRYLGTKKEKRDKTIENDAKYFEKRRGFEILRFDYYNYLIDVHGGRKIQNIALQLALFAQRVTDAGVAFGTELSNSSKPSIDGLVEDLKQTARDWNIHATEREYRRRALERSISDDPSLILTHALTQDDDSDEKFIFSDPKSPPKALVVEDTLTHKEGLLWALSRPGGIQETQNLTKQGVKWHKYWVVQDGGKLWEYANWKQGVDLHNEPIDLRVARVREASAADRRFCFEIVTPNYKRVFQATSDEDMKSWISHITRGITSSLENFSNNAPPRQTRSPVNSGDQLQVLKPRDTIEKLGENIGRKLSLKTKTRQTSPPPPPQPVYPSTASDSLLTMIQRTPSNRRCADCDSIKGVEWVSINLLVVVCIECSGAHRSLGSQITKIRSLTLDTVSFTKDLVDAFKEVSNSKMNSIWEARLTTKPVITDRNRLQYITEKYVEKAYIREIEKPNAALRRAIADQDLLKACTALAARANPNASSDEGEPLIIEALRCSPPDTTIFKIAEVLVVNGASIPTIIPDNLSPAAKTFLLQRSRRN